MITVRIIKNWNFPDLMQQTPGNQGLWGNIQFTEDEVDECDYLIVLNKSNKNIGVKCYSENIWAIIQEPPVKGFKKLHKGKKYFHRVYTSNNKLKDSKYIHSYPALPWHVNKSYDELKRMKCPQKDKVISCISSNKAYLKGHQRRLYFIDKIKNKIEFDLFGKGIRELKEKWDGLETYKYSIAIENFSNKFYWSEKISDCFLAWTMPVYYGCTNINEYFPDEAIINIDINNPKESIEIIKEAVSNNLWKKNYDAITYARELTLEKYNFFSFVTKEILDFEINNIIQDLPVKIEIKADDLTFVERIIRKSRKIIGKLL